MVYLEKTSDEIYIIENCLLSKFIQVTAELLPLPPTFIPVSLLMKERVVKNSPTRTLPMLKGKSNVIAGVMPIINYLLNEIDPEESDVKDILLGRNNKERAEIQMWLSFITCELWPILKEINQLLYGYLEFNKEKLSGLIEEAKSKLSVVNTHLNFRTFLTSKHVQLPDLMLAVFISTFYSKIMTEEVRNELPNVTRHFKFISRLKIFLQVLGDVSECSVQAEPLPFISLEERKKLEKKEEEKKKKEEKKNIKEEGKKEETKR